MLSQNLQLLPQIPQVSPVAAEYQYYIERRDIILENDINNQRYCMPSIEVKFRKGDEVNLNFTDLIERLKQMNFPLSNCMLFCWDQQREMHIFVANDPMPTPVFLASNLCGMSGSIYIKFRSILPQTPVQPQQQSSRISTGSSQGASNSHINKSFMNYSQSQQGSYSGIKSSNIGGSSHHQQHHNRHVKAEDSGLDSDDNTAFSSEQFGYDGCQKDSRLDRKKHKMHMMGMGGRGNSDAGGQATDKRVKERYIEKVRQKVSEWRAMHEIGVRDKDGIFQKHNLDYAANLIGISRKTLDDYYLQLRRAEQLGFDFEKNKSEKMGALRKFVKEESKKQPKGRNTSANNFSALDLSGNTNNNNNGGHSQIGDESDLDADISSLGQGFDNNSNNNNNNINNNNGKNLNLNAFGMISSNNGRGSSNNMSASTKSSMPSLANPMFGISTNSSSNFQQGMNSFLNSNPGFMSPQLGIASQLPQAASLITPYNLNNSTTSNNNPSNFGFNSGGFGQTQSQFRNSSGQQAPSLVQPFLPPSLLQYYPTNGRGSAMNQEPLIETLQRNSNTNNNMFSPGSQFLGIPQNGSNMSNPSLINGADFSLGNIMANESQLGGSQMNQNDQSRFSNHFSLISFGNNSQFTDERNGSINFMNQAVSNIPNLASLANNNNTGGNIEARQSSGQGVFLSNEDNFITTHVFPMHNPNNNNNNNSNSNNNNNNNGLSILNHIR